MEPLRKKQRLSSRESQPPDYFPRGEESKELEVVSKEEQLGIQVEALEGQIVFNGSTKINKIQFYHLLVGFDILYSGLRREWDPPRRSKSIAGFIFKKYTLLGTKWLSWLEEPSCPTDIDCNYRYFKNTENKLFLYINFGWGSNFIVKDFKQIWFHIKKPLIKALEKIEYDQLIFSGHSMGAGIIYMIILEIFKESLLPKGFNPSNLFVNFFGLGRVSTILYKEFIHLHNQYNFNILDFLTSSKPDKFGGMVLDNYIDNIMIADDKCNYTDSTHPYYCKNMSFIHSDPYYTPIRMLRGGVSGCVELKDEETKQADEETNQELYKCSLYGKFKPYSENKPDWLEGGENLTTDVFDKNIPDNYQDCSDPRKWGNIYSKKWNECQDFFDEYHRHNDLNTFIINNEGEIHSINKNTVLRDFEIQYSSPVTITPFNANIYHKIKKYNAFFKKNKLIKKLNQI